MIYSLIRSVVTNNMNDNENVTWFLARTEDEDWDFRYDQNDAVDMWNKGHPGYMSSRRVSMDIYYAEQFAYLTLDQLDGISLSMLKKVLDYIPNEEGATE